MKALVKESSYTSAKELAVAAVTILGMTAAPASATVSVGGGAAQDVPVTWNDADQTAKLDLSSAGLAINQDFALTWL
jgi:hypothetical protein